MSNNLIDKVVILTGAGGGIGRAAALKLAQIQAKLILLGGNNREKLEQTRVMASEYTFCTALPGDLTDLEFIKSAIRKITETFSAVDVLINNAGTAINTPAAEITPELYDRVMNINCKAPFFLTQQVLPYLKKSSSATIINIASVVAHAGYPLQSVYAASKHALLGWTKSLASEYYKENIRVHAISPGGVFTDMVKVSRPDLTGEGMIQPEEIAEIIHFLLAHRGNAVIDEILVHRVNKEPFLV